MGLFADVTGGLGLSGASAATQDVGQATPADEGADCKWYDMQLGNNIGHWRGDKPAIKYQYDHDLKGTEIHYWWPGKATLGECNNLDDPDGRGCWYKARLLNDPSCDQKGRCLHVAGHDGEPSHTYSCPTWMMNQDGIPCKLPPEWQACPRQFKLLRVNSGVPQDFKDALSTPCGPMGEDHCLGNTEFETDVGMYFDLRQNQWYKCTPWMKCEMFDIKAIVDPEQGPKGMKGAKCGKHTCKEDEACFDHRITSKQSTFHCMPKNKVFVISAGDDMALDSMPLPLALITPPAVPKSGRRDHKTVARRQSALLASFL